MFYPRFFDMSYVAARCQDKYGITPRPGWIRTAYGSESSMAATNIVFSNGGYDPWSSGGVKVAQNPSVAVLFIPTGAHHLDLFFTNPADPPELTQARKTEVGLIANWTSQWYAQQKGAAAARGSEL